MLPLPRMVAHQTDAQRVRSASLPKFVKETLARFVIQGLCMARGRKTSLTIRLTPSERQTLLAWQRATTISVGRARRGRIILLVADRMPISQIAETVGISRRFVYKWVQRFLEKGLEGLADKPGRGSHRVPRQTGLTEPHDMDVG
jgi:CRP-like cAMP-binding protein